MANPEHVAKLKEGVEAWNRWRLETPGVSFQPDFSGANLFRANLRGADLRGTDLRGADLGWVSLLRANLAGAELRRAVFDGTVFGDTDVRGATGLGSCRHLSSSVIDRATMQKSWPLPVEFLRGCGLPEHYIEYLPSLVGQAIEYNSCFISYSNKDQAFADRLHADLQDRGVRCWLATNDLRGGKKLHEQIYEAIQFHDRTLLILSEHSMASDWVKNEITKARERQKKEGRRVLFPIRLCGFARVEDWDWHLSREVSEYYIPNFTTWDDAEFATLLDALKTGAA